MSEQLPSEPSPEEMREREKVWQRVKETAKAWHRHSKDHGINTIIGGDAGRSSQAVGDWKHGRSPIPPGVLATLAAKYKVSARYLACLTDDPSQNAPADEAAMRAKMVELVDDVVKRLNPNVDPRIAIEMCNLALELLQEGKSEETIFGALYKRMRDTDPHTSTGSAKDVGQDHSVS